MKLVIVKKGTKKWTGTAIDRPTSCCWTIEAIWWPCYEIGLNG